MPPSHASADRITPQRWAFVAATALLLAGTAIYLHGFVQTLPYQLEPDEPNIFRFTTHLLSTGRLLNSYPPLRVAELALEYRLLDLVTPGEVAQPVYFLVGRYFSLLYGLLLLSVTYQAGRHLHSRAAGLAAMLFLIAQPDAVHLVKLIKTDVFAWLFGMTAILLAFRTLRGPRWLIAPAIGAGIAATLAKYTMLPVLLIPGLVLLFAVPRGRVARILLPLLALGVLAGGAYLILRPPEPLASFLMSFHARQLYERERLFQFVSLIPAWPHLMAQLGQVNFWGVLIGLPVAVLIWPRARLTRQQWAMLALVAATAIITYLLLGLFRTNRPQDRYLIVLGFALLWGVTLALLAGGRVEVVLAAALILTGPWLARAWRYGDELRWPDTRVMTAEWFIANVPEGTHIAVEKDYVEFERVYGGYPSDKIFFVEEITSVYDESLESFARRGVEYLIADYRNIWRGGFFDPERDNGAFLAQVETVLNLADPWPWERRWQGPARYVFRIPPLQQVPMHVFLGDAIIFKGYDLAPDTVAPGETLDLVLYWAALRETDANYIVFVHLLAPDGTLVAQRDGPPGDALHRTYDWQPGYFDWDEWPVEIPPETPPGTYTLSVGMYDADTLERLPAVGPDGTPLGDRIVLTEITVSGSR